MNLTIYKPCVEAQAAFDESTTGVWRDTPPLVGEMVSLGMEDRWAVVEVIQFKSLNLDFPIQLAFVNASPEVPKRENWIAYIAHKRCPEQGMTVGYSEVGQPIIQIGSVYGELTRKETLAFLGYDRELFNHWDVKDVQEALPLQPSPYRAIYMGCCSPKVLVAA